MDNKNLVDLIVLELKKRPDKKVFLDDIISDLKLTFSNPRFNSINPMLSGLTFSYEDTSSDHKNITPEIFSWLNELSLSLLKNQYETGSYYTNKELINTILSEFDYYNSVILDPASGVGNFQINIVLHLASKFENKSDLLSYISRYIYFNELVSGNSDIYIDRINYICIDLFKTELTTRDRTELLSNISNSDFLLDFSSDIKFDAIIGNPPYLGTKSLGEDYLKALKKEFGFTDDLYSLFIFKSNQFLNDTHFFSFVTSNTYFTLRSKKYVRELLIDNGLFKIINNNKSHFNILTNTSIFFCKSELINSDINMFSEDNDGLITLSNSFNPSSLSGDKRFALNDLGTSNTSKLFELSIDLYEENKKFVSTTKSLSSFIASESFKQIISKNDVLPLGLIAYIATGVDFKGNNKDVLFSVDNHKYNLITDINLIQDKLSKQDFLNGLSKPGKMFIKAIKGTEHLFVKWDKTTFDFLKSIKAPLRNLSLYGDEVLYCKTSTYEFTKVDKNTLCINTAGACFIKPVIDISIDDIFKQVQSSAFKDYIKNHINNSLCLTPNDLKVIPIKIR